MSARRQLVLGVLLGAVVFAGFAVWAAANYESRPPKPYVATAEGAYRVCTKFVRDKLRAPGSAEFGPFDEAEVSYVASRGGFWDVRGTVEADNAFGAHLRSDFICQVRHAEDRRWTLDVVLFGEASLQRR